MTCYSDDAHDVAQGFAELAARAGASWRWFDEDRNIIELTIGNKMFFFDVIELAPDADGHAEVAEWLEDGTSGEVALGSPQPVDEGGRWPTVEETEAERHADDVLLFGEEKARELAAWRASR